jgi:predicted dehydrogenase
LSSTSIGIAVVGAGYWGNKLVREYLSLSESSKSVRLKRIVDSSKDRLMHMETEFGLPRSLLETDIRTVLSDPSINAVHVATPNETHFALGISVLESGRHLLLEKPMALSVGEAVKLARAAEQRSLLLQVGHIFRFNNSVKLARDLLADGTLGKPFYFGLRWDAFLEPPPGRDIIFDLGPHPVDVLNLLSNEWPVRVLALGKSFLRKKANQEEATATILEFDDDVFAHLSMSWLYAGPKRREISITGEKGSIEVDALNQEIMVYTNSSSRPYPVQVNNTIEAMITHFIRTILKEEAPQNSALTGIMNVAVLHSMKESMTSKRFTGVLGGEFLH